MTPASAPRLFLCNGAPPPDSFPADAHVTALNYLHDDPNRLVTLRLPRFVDQFYHLPDRILDLLELAAYVFAADRAAFRGAKDAVEYHAWSRSMFFVVKVRDAAFWNQARVKQKLSAAIRFMTGDFDYSFEFLGGHTTPPASLFDKEEFAITSGGAASVALFSGGLDSLAGVLERLETTREDLYLISHRSGQPSIKKTQAGLARAVYDAYPGRVHRYSFDCGLANERGAEETQRTRAFLFGSIAFAVAHRLGLDSFFAYENGVTSLNFIRRQDLMNARASRTTHPQTHALMADFLAEVHGKPVNVVNPFWTKTKADVFAVLDRVKGRNLISSAVSCSKTFQRLPGNATHCGCCFQCIDRRIAAYAAGLQEIDNAGIYSTDIFRNRIETVETKTTALDYVRQAVHFANTTDDGFAMERLAELSDVTPFLGMEEDAAVEAVWSLCHRHGEQVVKGLSAVRSNLDDLRCRLEEGSLLHLLAAREHLKQDPLRLAERIAEMLATCLPVAFKSGAPTKEDTLNDQIDALLRAHGDDFRREFPATKFALAKVVPDHEALDADLLIEAKYIRKGTSPSKASEGIAADITKYPADDFILFVVYDPYRAISDDTAFKQGIESKRACLVALIR
jgi:7-cyano-7-deazaguanine synthase in queuosine biosynthesis